MTIRIDDPSCHLGELEDTCSFCRFIGCGLSCVQSNGISLPDLYCNDHWLLTLDLPPASVLEYAQRPLESVYNLWGMACFSSQVQDHESLDARIGVQPYLIETPTKLQGISACNVEWSPRKEAYQHRQSFYKPQIRSDSYW